MAEPRVSGLTEDQVNIILTGHDARMKKKRRTWRMYRAAFDGRFWEAPNIWTRGPRALMNFAENTNSIPVKNQVNIVRARVNALLAQLYYRKLRTSATPPIFMANKPGRPKEISPQLVEGMSALGSELLNRGDFEAMSTHAYQLSLMYGASAFKTSIDDTVKGDAIDQLSVDVILPWNLLLDERARSGRWRWQGHVRYEPVEWFEDKFGSEALPDKIHATHIPDFLEDGLDSHADDEHRDPSYLRVLEVYDRHKVITVGSSEAKGELSYWLADNSNPKLFPLGESPFPFADVVGRGITGITPVVLQNVPEYPLHALSTIDNLYELAAERNLLLSILASAMRRDAARVILFLSERGVNQGVLDQIAEGRDLALVEIEGETLEGLFKELDIPRMAGSLDKYKQWLTEARQEVQPGAELIAGRPSGKGKTPLSATESNRLAGAADADTGQVGKRMALALSDNLEQQAVVLATAMKDNREKALKFRSGQDVVTIPREVLMESWSWGIQDSTATPAREAQTRADFVAIAQPLLDLALVATEQPDTPVGNMAQRQIDFYVEKWDLPDNFLWDFISDVEEVETPEAPAGDVAGDLGQLGPEAIQALLKIVREQPELLQQGGAPAGVAPQGVQAPPGGVI